jgi:hypothetical protein
MAVYLDVIIDVDRHHFPFGVNIRCLWQWFQGGKVDGFKLIPSTTRQLAKRPLIEFDQQNRNRLVQLGKCEKGLKA